MAVLNFPTNPTPNQLYSFGGKTWIWTGQGWRLNSQGSINNIPIGNITPSTGTFTTVSAIGNVVSNQYFVGNGRLLTGIQASSGSYIENGNTTVEIPQFNGNILFTVDTAANVLTVTNTDLIADINVVPTLGNVYTLGTFEKPWAEGYFSNTSVWVGNAKLSANATSIIITNPEGGEFVFSGNINYAPYDDANVISLLSNFGSNPINTTADISTTGNVTAANFIGNVIGNVSGNLTISAGNTQVIYSNNGTAVGNPNFTFNQATNVLNVTGNITATGNVQADYLLGNATALTGAMVDRGSDTNNWDALTQMGVYTVNRTSWAGTTGTPLDSQIFVGLLEVKNSTDTAIEQVFYPGTVDLGNVKIQWNRANWDGSWTTWIKIVNDDQVFTGGTF